MPTGHFTIGDLSFSFEGSLKELAHSQEIIREINQATYRLKQAADAEEVKIIYDQDLQGERGTFDKMRLRAYTDQLNYTLDLGVTDTNPLGIYVGYDQNIEVYNRETGEDWEITPDGEVVGKSSKQEPQNGPSRENGRPNRNGAQAAENGSARPPGRKGKPQASGASNNGASSGRREPSRSTKQSASDQEGTGNSLDGEEAMNLLIKQISVYPDQKLAGNTTVGEKEEPLDEKIWGFAKFCGRDEDYYRRVKRAQGFQDASNLKIGEVDETLRLIFNEQRLLDREEEVME